VIGFCLMLLSSYIDSLRGPIMPMLREELNLSPTVLSHFLVCGHIAAMLATLVLMRLLNRFHEQNVLFLVLVASLSVGLWSLVPLSMTWFYTAAVLFGGLNTSIGMFSNIMVMRVSTPANEGRLLSALHTLYGVGSLIVAALIGWLLDSGLPWTIAAMLTWIPILYMLIHAIGLRRQRRSAAVETQHARLKFIHILLFVIFGLYVAGEVTTSMWMTTYLCEVLGFSEAHASFYLSGFFIAMTVTRIFATMFATQRWQVPMLWFAILLPILCHGLALSGLGLALCAAGFLGPFFPVLLARVKSSFPKEWRAVTGWIVFAIQMTMIFVHLGVGRLASAVGMKIAYLAPMGFFIVLIPILALYLREEKRHRCKIQT
jgi:fucose permease